MEKRYHAFYIILIVFTVIMSHKFGVLDGQNSAQKPTPQIEVVEIISDCQYSENLSYIDEQIAIKSFYVAKMSIEWAKAVENNDLVSQKKYYQNMSKGLDEIKDNYDFREEFIASYDPEIIYEEGPYYY